MLIFPSNVLVRFSWLSKGAKNGYRRAEHFNPYSAWIDFDPLPADHGNSRFHLFLLADYRC